MDLFSLKRLTAETSPKKGEDPGESQWLFDMVQIWRAREYMSDEPSDREHQ